MEELPELPELYLEEEDAQPVTGEAHELNGLGDTTDLVKTEDFSWPVFRCSWSDFLPVQVAELYLGITRHPLPSLLSVVDGNPPLLFVSFPVQTSPRACLTEGQSSGSTLSLAGGSQVPHICITNDFNSVHNFQRISC